MLCWRNRLAGSLACAAVSLVTEPCLNFWARLLSWVPDLSNQFPTSRLYREQSSWKFSVYKRLRTQLSSAATAFNQSLHCSLSKLAVAVTLPCSATHTQSQASFYPSFLLNLGPRSPGLAHLVATTLFCSRHKQWSTKPPSIALSFSLCSPG